MSESQYYEFYQINEPIFQEARKEISSLSNGNFCGSSRQLLVKYFRIIKKFNVWLIISIFYANFCLAEIIQTHDFKVIEDKVRTADYNTLVIFDIDHVLLQPKDQLLKSYCEEFRKFIKEIELQAGKAMADELYHPSPGSERKNGNAQLMLVA